MEQKASNEELTNLGILVGRIQKAHEEAWDDRELMATYIEGLLFFLRRLRGAENAAGLTMREAVDHATEHGLTKMRDLALTPGR